MATPHCVNKIIAARLGAKPARKPLADTENAAKFETLVWDSWVIIAELEVY